MGTLNLFPARVAIGTLQPNGDVLMTPEFFRALTDLLQRVGGPTGTNADEMEALFAIESSDPGTSVASEKADNALLMSLFDTKTSVQDQCFDSIPLDSNDAAIAAAVARIDALEVIIAAQADAIASASQSLAYAQYTEIEYAFVAPPVDWDHPGKIGFRTPNTGAFTAITTTTSAQIGTGFGCNGKTPQTAFALGAAATDLPTVITLANNLRTMSINNGIGS